jgi:hypothetical protein
VSDPLFREEAVEHVRRARGGGDVVRIAPPWTEIAVWALAALAVGALAASAIVRVDRLRLVPAVAQGGSRVVQAAVPEDAAGRLRPGARTTFALTETGDRVGVRVTRLGAPQGHAVPVLARADHVTRGGAGVLEVKVGDRPLISQLVPGSSSER